MVNKSRLYYFSPTGGTKRVGESFCSEISQQTELIDLGVPDNRCKETAGELAVVAVPVFGGRIPALVADRLRKLDGAGNFAVTMVVYGNRAYEDALVELNDIAAEIGFQVIASGAFIAQHSMVPDVAAGRPDEQDFADIRNFARAVASKIAQGACGGVTVPGNRPYKKSMSMSVTPISLPACTLCQVCVKACPTQAITVKDGAIVTNTQQCILCMACAAACPEHARILPPPLREKLEQMLGNAKTVRQENVCFLS